MTDVPELPTPLPKHVAIIMDGNGRWAQRQGLPVVAGHEAGADTVKARLRDAAELGVEELTVFSFSTENWTRPSAEVEGLMRMFDERIASETPELNEEGVRMRFVGRGVDRQHEDRQFELLQQIDPGTEQIAGPREEDDRARIGARDGRAMQRIDRLERRGRVHRYRVVAAP